MKIKKFITLMIAVLLTQFMLVADPVKKTAITTKYKDVAVYVVHDGHNTIQCYKCKQTTQIENKGYSYCLGCPAWRRYDIAHIKEGDAIYVTYKCQHGHTLLVSLTTDDIK